MSDRYGVEMSKEEIAAFLAEHGHGVLSFTNHEPYAFPVSFGYDIDDDRCVLQLLYNPESRKRDYITGDDPVSLVSYEWSSPDDWQSVVISGTLVHIEEGTPAAIDAAAVFAPYATTVSMTVFDRPIEELDPEWYEIRIEEMTGRRSPLLE